MIVASANDLCEYFNTGPRPHAEREGSERLHAQDPCDIRPLEPRSSGLSARFLIDKRVRGELVYHHRLILLIYWFLFCCLESK